MIIIDILQLYYLLKCFLVAACNFKKLLIDLPSPSPGTPGTPGIPGTSGFEGFIAHLIKWSGKETWKSWFCHGTKPDFIPKIHVSHPSGIL